MTWVLILTLMTWDGIAVSQVNGFQTKDACMSAASTWLKQANDLPRTYGSKAVCAQTR